MKALWYTTFFLVGHFLARLFSSFLFWAIFVKSSLELFFRLDQLVVEHEPFLLELLGLGIELDDHLF